MRGVRFALGAFVLVCAALAPGAAAALDPPAFEARFDMEARGFVVAEVRWTLQRKADGFVFESRSEASGIAALLGDNRVVEQSEWQDFDGTPRPARYRYRRSGRRAKSVSIDFDWGSATASATASGAHSRYSVPAGALDGLSYVLAMMEDLRAGEQRMRYQVASANRLREYVLAVQGRERLDTALGALETLRVERIRDDDRRKTTIWLAPALGFVPVRIDHQEDDGDSLSIRITALGR